MWGLDNRTAYEAERGWILDKDGAKHWVVVVKGTFDIAPDGTTALSEAPVPPLLIPQYFGEDGMSSLQYEADIMGPKAATDVTLNGSAYAPNGSPTTRMTVTLVVGRLHKTIEVIGDREYERHLSGQVLPGPSVPFEIMPLVYERAFGGFDRTARDPAGQLMDARNPVGRGCAANSRHLLGTRAPNLSLPGRDPARSGPAGFGAIASFWSPRREFAGTYDARWLEERRPLLPEDFDQRFYQSAPLDQQISPYLRGGEPVILSGMSLHGVLRFELPRVYLVMTTHFGFEMIEHRPQLASVIIEPDIPRVLMVWQSVIPCHHLVDVLDKTVIRQKAYV